MPQRCSTGVPDATFRTHDLNEPVDLPLTNQSISQIAEFKQKIRKLRAVRPQISLSSDFIVGFPTETVYGLGSAADAFALLERLEQEFEKTLIRRALAHTGGHRMEAAAWLGWGFDIFDGLLFNYVAPNCVPTLLGLAILVLSIGGFGVWAAPLFPDG